jgi:hypothetical protein
MIDIIKLFIKLFLYKFLLFNLDIFKRFLFEKHFYLFNKFITLYVPSSVSTEFRKILFSKDQDVHDELYGDSNFLLNSKNFLNYLKNFDRLKFNLLNFNYLLNFRQYNRSKFFIDLKTKISNFVFLKQLTATKFNKILFTDIIFEKIKLLYVKKSFFSYVVFFIEFLILLFYIIFFKKKKKTNFSIYNYLSIEQHNVNLKKYFNLRMNIFHEYLLLKKDLKKNSYFVFLIEGLKKVDFIYFYFLNIFTKLLFFLNKINLLFFLMFLILFTFDFSFLKNFKKLGLYFYFQIYFFINKINFIYCVNFKNYILSFFSFSKFFKLTVYNFFLSFKVLFFFKLIYFYKYTNFYKFLFFFIKNRNKAYLNLLSILFSIKKDLKRRYEIIMSQTFTRQKNDFKDLDIYEYINNISPEDKNKDLFFLLYLSKFRNKYKNYLYYNKGFSSFGKMFKRKNLKKINLIKLNNKKKNIKKVNYIKDSHLSFFSKYLYNLGSWLFLIKNNKKTTYLSSFLLRKLFFQNQNKVFNLKKMFFFTNLDILFKIRYFRLSNKIKFFLKLNNLLYLNILKTRNKKFKKSIKFNKINKNFLLKVFYNIKKRRVITYKLYKEVLFCNKPFYKKYLIKKKNRKKKMKLFFSLDLFFQKSSVVNKNFFFLKHYLFIKLKKKKHNKKLKNLRRKFLHLHTYKILKKRKKVNFISFFEQSEDYLLTQKRFAFTISKYKINNNFSWFSDLHNYTFFHKYFILKRDRFWYSVAKRESIIKYHDGRNMMTDSWEENFFLQQRSFFFFKEGYQTSFILRNNFVNFSSLKLLQILENSVLKKHVFLSFLWNIFFFYLIIFMVTFFLNKYFFLMKYSFLLSFVFLISLFPFIINFFYFFSSYKYRLNKIYLLLYLRKPYIYYKYNFYIFFQFFSYFSDIFSKVFFFKKTRIIFFIFNFFGNKLLKKLKNFEKGDLFLLLFVKFVFYFIILIILLNSILLFYLNNEVLLYNLIYKILSYYFLNFFVYNIIIIIIFFFLIYFFINKCIFYFTFLNNKILDFIVRFYFDNNFFNFINFLNIFFFKSRFSNKFNINELNEQLNILKNIKNLQYQQSLNKLKKCSLK